MFINMGQACGHWKIGKNTLLQNDHFNVTVFKTSDNMYIIEI